MRRFRVIPGGKSQHDDRPQEPGPALYRAYSTGKFVKGSSTYHDVRFHWYCLERAEPAADYGQVIADYDEMDPDLRKPFERFVDRHFTETEVSELRAYLEERYGLGVDAERITLPVRDRAFLFEEGSSVIYEFLELSERPGYTLPFKVWGYFTLKGRLAQPMLDHGVELVITVLRKLGMASPLGRDRLETALKEVYEEKRLIVRKSDEVAEP